MTNSSPGHNIKTTLFINNVVFGLLLHNIFYINVFLFVGYDVRNDVKKDFTNNIVGWNYSHF